MKGNKVIKLDGKYFVCAKNSSNRISCGYDSKADAQRRLNEVNMLSKSNSRLVNVSSKLTCNADSVSERTFEGTKHIVIRNAKHMIGDTVMNRILYPSDVMNELCDEIVSGDVFIPAPAEHPRVNGNFSSASDPRSMINHNIGAFHFNFRVESGRLVSDTAVNPDIARTTDKGAEILRRIDDQEDIDMSTGFYLLCDDEGGMTEGGEDYDKIARKLMLDHSALLTESEGAKTTAEGVGLFANDANGAEVLVVNSSLESAASMGYSSKGFLTGLAEKGVNIGGIAGSLGINESTANNVMEQISVILDSEKKDGEFLYVVDLIEGGFFVYSKADKGLFKGGYLTDSSGTVSLTEEPHVCVRRNVDYIEVNNGNDNMKDKILAALNSAGVDTEGMSDDALLSAYDDSLSVSAIAANQTEIEKAVSAAIKPVVDELASITANSKKEEKEKRETLVSAIAANGQYDADDLAGASMSMLMKMSANSKTAGFVTAANASTGASDVLGDYQPVEG